MALMREDIAEVVHAAVPLAVAETFKMLGVDVSKPFEVQRDMAHLRFSRLLFEGVFGKIMALGLIAAVLAGAFLLLRVSPAGVLEAGKSTIVKDQGARVAAP